MERLHTGLQQRNWQMAITTISWFCIHWARFTQPGTEGDVIYPCLPKSVSFLSAGRTRVVTLITREQPVLEKTLIRRDEPTAQRAWARNCKIHLTRVINEWTLAGLVGVPPGEIFCPSPGYIKLHYPQTPGFSIHSTLSSLSSREVVTWSPPSLFLLNWGLLLWVFG